MMSTRSQRKTRFGSDPSHRLSTVCENAVGGRIQASFHTIRMGCKPYNTVAHRAELFRFSDWNKKFRVHKNPNIPKAILTAARAFDRTPDPLLSVDAKGRQRYISQQPNQYRVIVLHKNANRFGEDVKHYGTHNPFTIYPEVDENLDLKESKLKRQLRILDFNTKPLLPSAPKVVHKPVQPFPYSPKNWENLLPTWSKNVEKQNIKMEMAQTIEILKSEATLLLDSPLEQATLSTTESYSPKGCPCEYFANKPRFTVVNSSILDVNQGVIMHCVGDDFTCGKGVAKLLAEHFKMSTHFKISSNRVNRQISPDKKVEILSLATKSQSAVPGNKDVDSYRKNLKQALAFVSNNISKSKPIHVPGMIGCALDGMKPHDIYECFESFKHNVIVHCVHTPKKVSPKKRRAPLPPVLKKEEEKVESDDDSDIDFDFTEPEKPVVPQRRWVQRLRGEKSFLDVVKPYASKNPVVTTMKEKPAKPAPQPKKYVPSAKHIEEQANRKWVRENLSRFPMKVKNQVFRQHKNPSKPEDRSPKAMNAWKQEIIKVSKERELALYAWSKVEGNRLLKPVVKLPEPKPKVWVAGEWSGPLDEVYVPSFQWALAPNSPYKGKSVVQSLNSLMEEARKKAIQAKEDKAREEAMEKARLEAEKLQRKKENKAKKLAKKPKEDKSLGKHEHTCVYCRRKYIHYHPFTDVNHVQYDNQCPWEDCPHFHGGLNDRKAEKLEEPVVVAVEEITPAWSTSVVIDIADEAEEAILQRPRPVPLPRGKLSLEAENAALKAELVEMRAQISALTEQLTKLTSLLANQVTPGC